MNTHGLIERRITVGAVTLGACLGALIAFMARSHQLLQCKLANVQGVTPNTVFNWCPGVNDSLTVQIARSIPGTLLLGATAGALLFAIAFIIVIVMWLRPALNRMFHRPQTHQ